MQLDSVPSQYRTMFLSAMGSGRAAVRTFLGLGVPPDLTRQVVGCMFRHSILVANLEPAEETTLLTLGAEMLNEAVEIETAGEFRHS